MGLENQGILGGLSPEEILAMKEMQGGVKYDDPFVPESPIIEEDLPVQESLPREVMMNSKPPITEEFKNLYSDQPSVNRENPESLGKAETYILPTPPPIEIPSFNQGLELGWKNLPLNILPSRGLFYPNGAKIAIRPAETKEVRHYSSIDEDDLLDLNEKLNFIIEKCSVINFPERGVVSYKDLKQEDRFFIIMAIRDLTFLQGENRIILTPETNCKDKNSCPINSGIELRTGVLSSYEIDQKILNYYSPLSRSFIFPVRKLGKEIEMFVPSIGVMDSISQFVANSVTRGIEIDDSFIKIAPFLFKEWIGLDDKKIIQTMRESDEWSKEEFSLYFELSNSIKIGTELEVKLNCPSCGAEVAAPITFPGGFRSLFVISDIFGELL
jgi:hypothetical protein